MNILGLSAFYHESACCLLQDGRLAAAAAEERFSRVKYDAALPVQAFRFCLDAAGLTGSPLTVADLDAIAYYERPADKLARQLWSKTPAGASPDLPWLDAEQPLRAIRERLGFDGPILTFPHHASHAASSYYFSGFGEAAVLTVDGVGEWATTTYGYGRGKQLESFEEVRFPHSLGLLYATLTSYLGFRVNGGEYKVMGLAPYGEPRYLDALRKLVLRAGTGRSGTRHETPGHDTPGHEDGQFELDLDYFDFVRGRRMYSRKLCQLLGREPRQPESEIDDFHKDVACSLQALLEELLLDLVGYLHRTLQRRGTPSDNLCLAGGVALNCVANARIRRDSPFQRLFVQPAAGDAGGCVGAAALAHVQLTGERPARLTGPASEPLPHVYLGPSWHPDTVARLLDVGGLPAQDFRGRESDLADAVAEHLAERRTVGFFRGAMEFGPRALGARSILANPLDPDIRDRLNAVVKKREAFRPFAPSVLAEHAADHFDLDHPSPFMLETCQVTSTLELPGITHVDGSARPQTVDRAVSREFAAILDAFHRRTGCPLLVNTSFNVRGEPIVCTPTDALFCFADSGLDVLVLEDHLLDRRDLPDGWVDLVNAWKPPRRAVAPQSRGSRNQNALREHLYTFV